MLLFFLSKKYGHVGSYFVDKITKNIMVKINFKSDAWLIRYQDLKLEHLPRTPCMKACWFGKKACWFENFRTSDYACNNFIQCVSGHPHAPCAKKLTPDARSTIARPHYGCMWGHERPRPTNQSKGRQSHTEYVDRAPGKTRTAFRWFGPNRFRLLHPPKNNFTIKKDLLERKKNR